MKISQIPAVDVVVVGGGTAAISAAFKLKKENLNVMVIGGRTYFGEDVCDSLRLFLPDDMDMSHPLAERFYGEAYKRKSALRPMDLKLGIERTLRDAQIPYLLTSTPGEVLIDEQGRVAGLTICNRSGRQFIPCQVIIDGSLRGEAARLAGATITEPDKELTVIRRIIGGVQTVPEQGVWIAEGKMTYTSVIPSDEWEFKEAETEETLWAYQTQRALKDGSWASWMRLEQDVRMDSYRPGQHMGADGIFVFTGEKLATGVTADLDQGLEQLSADSVSISHRSLFVTGLLANVSDEERIIRHDYALIWGEKIADLVLENLPPSQLSGGRSASNRRIDVEAKELIDDLRWQEQIDLDASFEHSFAAIQEVDVLVVGGGTGGAPAGVSAARAGASTLVCEYCSALGGIGTVGLIGSYYFGHRVGFTAEMDKDVRVKSPMKVPDGSWDVEAKMQWYHEEIVKAGGDVWYKSMSCGALVEGNKVVGAIIATPQGRVAVKAKAVVDSTGSADVAAAAGAQTERIGSKHVASQGTGLGARNPGVRYDNTDYDFIDVNDVQDVTSAFSTAREKFSNAFDLQQIIDSRERRRIIGDIEISPMDILLERVYPDTVSKAYSNFDTHGFTVNPFFLLVPPDHAPRTACIPMRALLPRGIEGILLTGLGISADRDAMPVLRMQACVQNQGFAAGLAAAISDRGMIRDLDVAALQRRLVDVGNLEEEMVAAKDSFTLADEQIQEAVESSAKNFDKLGELFTRDYAEIISRVKDAYGQQSDPEARLRYAQILAVLGDASGEQDLIEYINSQPWDEGWDYKGMGQFGESMSRLDSYIMALGLSGSKKAADSLNEKIQSLPDDAAFSHYRALSEAMGQVGDQESAVHLRDLLKRPNLCGHSQHEISDRINDLTEVRQETGVRNRALIELHIARALVELEPTDEAGRKILQNYAKDQRATFARHAKAILDERAKHMRKIG